MFFSQQNENKTNTAGNLGMKRAKQVQISFKFNIILAS